jgi:alpha-glucuronidase
MGFVRLAGMVVGLAVGLFLSAGQAAAEDGHDLWLRYRAMEPAAAARYRPWAAEIVEEPGLVAGKTRVSTATGELDRGLKGLLGTAPSRRESVDRDGAILIGVAESPVIARLNLPLKPLGAEGYLIRSVTMNGHKTTVIAANSDTGTLYGAFAFLRLMQTRQAIDRLDIASAPKLQLRVIDHWDNLNGTIERGYAGGSLWDWQRLPVLNAPRYVDYARAEASIGVNGVVLNNVNASADSLTSAYLAKAAALADVFRPYGIKVYLSARWSAPIELDRLPTADPLDPRVQAWWKAKADEIYRYIPDFGGFLVKANSEGQPGPGDYHRTHAEGANMLADAVKPHGGVVMWRAFVYSQDVPDDRAKQAYSEFKPLDGQFRDNVLVQVKNGPIDFQPREPFHPLFGAMPKTSLMLELQITREYLGQGTGVVYLGPLFEEALKSDTFAKGKGSTIAKVIDGSLEGHKLTGIAGVANTGADRDWSGTTFDQANWYAFGRLAWDPDASAKTIAEDWLKMTFTADPGFVQPALQMMMGSRETAVDFMTPLGLHHQMARNTHYGPGPWVTGGRADQTSLYFSKVGADGIGFDRTRNGSNAIAQYAPEVAAPLADPKTTPDTELLWFHHLAWDYRLPTGETLWDGLVGRYDRGIGEVEGMQKTWATLKPYVDAERFSETTAMLALERREAQWWRNASIAFYQGFSHRPTPAGHPEPAHPASFYEGITSPYAAGF